MRRLAGQALKSMAHRARAGYWIQGEKLQNLGDPDAIQPTRSSAILGGCLDKSVDIQDDVLLHGVIYGPSGFDSGSIIRRIGGGDLSGLASELANVDGAYAFAFFSDDGLIVGRDPLGVKPLYMAQGEHVVAVASEVKALTSVGFKEFERVAPGWVYDLRLDSQKKYVIRALHDGDQLQVGLNEASERVLDLLTDAVRCRVSGRKRVCVGFSGGLDSSLIALIVSRLVDVDLVTVCTDHSRDRVEAEKAARLLGLAPTIQTVDEALVKETLGGIPQLIESEKIMDVSIGLALHLVAKKAWEMRCEGLLLGQFADELFGGYARYLTICQTQGWESVQNALSQDVSNAHRINFERDDKAASPFTQLDLPYTSINLVNYALQLPPGLKINPLQNIRKTVLQRAAVKAGLPEEIAFKAKKAIQFSSGIQRVVKDHLLKSPSSKI